MTLKTMTTGKQRHTKSMMHSLIVSILVLVSCLCFDLEKSRTVTAQTTTTTTTTTTAAPPNFGYVSCPVCSDGETLTSAASTIPVGLLPFITIPITCIELEIKGLNLEISPPDCQYLRINATITVSQNICGCKSFFIPTIPVVAPVVAPVVVPAPAPIVAPIVAPVVVPVPAVAIVPTIAPIVSVIPVTTAPILLTMVPIPTITLAPVIVPPSITINSTIRIRLFFVNALMVEQSITDYQKTVSLFFTNNLNVSQYTNISSKIIKQDLISSGNDDVTVVATTRSISQRMRMRMVRSLSSSSLSAKSASNTQNNIRYLQQSSTTLGDSYPLDTFVDVTASSIDPMSNSTNFVNTLITVARDNIDELQSAISDLSTVGIINPIYFANIIEVNVTDPVYVGPITSPPLPTKPPTEQDEDGGLSNGAIIVIVLVLVNLVAFIGYQVYNKAYPKQTDDEGDEEEEDDEEEDDKQEKETKAGASMAATTAVATAVTTDSVATPRKSNVVDTTNTAAAIGQSTGEDTRDGLMSSNNNTIVPLNPFSVLEEEEKDVDISGDDPTETFSPQAHKKFMGNGGDDDDDDNDDENEDGAGDDKDGNSYAFSLEAGTDDGLNTATGTEVNTKTTSTVTSLDNIEDYDGKIAVPLSALVSGSTIAIATTETRSGRNGTSTTASMSVKSNITDDGTNTQIDNLFTNPKNMINRIVVAPAGKLGIVIDTTIEGPVVHKVFTNSPLETKIFVGDIIIAIDNVDTRAMSAAAISDLMVRTANQPRKLSVLSADDIRL